MAEVEGESARQNRAVKRTTPLPPNGAFMAPMLLMKHWRGSQARSLRLGNLVPITEKDKRLRREIRVHPNFRSLRSLPSRELPQPEFRPCQLPQPLRPRARKFHAELSRQLRGI